MRASELCRQGSEEESGQARPLRLARHALAAHAARIGARRGGRDAPGRVGERRVWGGAGLRAMEGRWRREADGDAGGCGRCLKGRGAAILAAAVRGCLVAAGAREVADGDVGWRMA